MVMTSESLTEGISGAIFGGERNRYRYALWRFWNVQARKNGTARAVMFILTNASMAGAYHNDPTVLRCCAYGRKWGYDGLYIGNFAAEIDTHLGPGSARRDLGSLVGPENDEWLIKMRDLSVLHVAGWGWIGDRYPERTEAVKKLFPKLHYLELAKSGFPKHPLYLAGDLEPKLW
jgi:hypothetical protein